jgi:hypothetical protein
MNATDRDQEMSPALPNGVPPATPFDRLQDAVSRLSELTRGRVPGGRSHQGADDEIGTADTDDAIGFDPMPLLRALDAHGARVVAIGQVAGILHGSQELTGDLDLLWDGDIGQAAALAAAFGSVSAELADSEGVPVPCEPAAFGLPKVLFRSPAASGDCCTVALKWGDLAVSDFLSRCCTAAAPDGFLIRPDLILMRRAIARPKDLRRVAELEALA